MIERGGSLFGVSIASSAKGNDVVPTAHQAKLPREMQNSRKDHGRRMRAGANF